MTFSQLTKLRLNQQLSVTEISGKLGCTPEEYLALEDGTVQISEKNRAILADVLESEPEFITAEDNRFDYSGTDSTLPEDKRYYGEIAIAFNNNERLLLPISVDMHSKIIHQMELEGEFIAIKSLDNRTVIVNQNQVLDIHLSEDASNDYGPDKDLYPTQLGVLPIITYWQNLDNVMSSIIEGEQDNPEAEALCNALIASNVITGWDDPKLLSSSQHYKHALQLVCSFSNGVVRAKDVWDDKILGSIFRALDDIEIPKYIEIDDQESGTTGYINPFRLNYVSIPTHKLENALLDEMADALGG